MTLDGGFHAVKRHFWNHILKDAVLFVRRIDREKEAKNFANELHEVQNSRESVLREVAELKVQLKIVEESRDSFRHNLMDSNRQLREGLYSLVHICHIISVTKTCICF